MQSFHVYPTRIVAPTNGDLRKAWHIVENDQPLTDAAYTDDLPTFSQLIHGRNTLFFPWFVVKDGRLMAIQILHDVETLRPPVVHDVRRTGWSFMWIHPDARGREAATTRVEMMEHVINLGYAVPGVSSPFAAVMADNKAANQVAIDQGFTVVGVYEKLFFRQEELVDLVIYCWNPDDRELAWESASQRAKGEVQPFPEN